MDKSDKIIVLNDVARVGKEIINIKNGGLNPTYTLLTDPFKRIDSEIRFFNDETGEEIFKPLHNKTVIAGSALTAQKLFGLDRVVLENTPTYDEALDLQVKAHGAYPTMTVYSEETGQPLGSVSDETQRVICGFCVGQGGAGLDISDVFEVEYCSWITPEMIVPFRYPLATDDNVPELYYKGKAVRTLDNGDVRNAYYFKEFSNTPELKQTYVNSIGSFNDNVNQANVYSGFTDKKAQTYVELHLKITKDDCREFFIAHKGLETAKINQISLVSGWRRTVTVGEVDYQYMQDIRPFSLLNIPNEILSELDKSISMIYTLFF